MTTRFTLGACAVLLLSACAPSEPAADMKTAAPPAAPAPAPTSDEGMIASASAAAPTAVSKDATIIAFNEKMEARELRKGTNGWTCIPDNPESPGTDPMCVDKNGWEWAGAWMTHKDPPKGKVGLGYMLKGGSDASNTDPFATKPAEGHPWVDTGPHVMILGAGAQLEGYPTTPDNPKAPYVMYPNTPYAHLMMPVM